MKSTPMLMSGPLVVATLAGLKTHTCRPVRLPPGYEYDEVFSAIKHDGPLVTLCCDPGPSIQVRCPFGTVGDQIWIRETWRVGSWKADGRVALDYRAGPTGKTPWLHPPMGEFQKLATQSMDDCEKGHRSDPASTRDEGDRFAWDIGNSPCRWRPSIHMPRWASRVTLEVTSVSVFRVQAITEEIAKREGVTPDDEPCDHPRQSCADVGCIGREWKGYRAGFAQVWIGLYGRESWSANPWVWGIGFRRVQP